jgi:hypothetical protein
VKSLISLVGVVMTLAGVWLGGETFAFQRRAIAVQATVTGVQELRGPPKPRQRTPLHVSYKLSDGREYSAITHLPLLQEIKQGDSIRLLVDPTAPERARLPLISELWARPLTYLVGGILLVVVGRVLSSKRTRG